MIFDERLTRKRVTNNCPLNGLTTCKKQKANSETREDIEIILPKTTITKSYSIHVLGMSNDNIVTRY